MPFTSAAVYKDFAFVFSAYSKDVIVFKDREDNDAAADND